MTTKKQGARRLLKLAAAVAKLPTDEWNFADTDHCAYPIAYNLFGFGSNAELFGIRSPRQSARLFHSREGGGIISRNCTPKEWAAHARAIAKKMLK